MPSVSVAELAAFVNGQHSGDGSRAILGVASLTQAKSDQLSFLSNRKYAADLAATKAGAILVPKNLEGDEERWIGVDDPYFSMAPVRKKCSGSRPIPKGISPPASIAPSAKLRPNVAVGPFPTIGENTVIGDNTPIFQNVS